MKNKSLSKEHHQQIRTIASYYESNTTAVVLLVAWLFKDKNNRHKLGQLADAEKTAYELRAKTDKALKPLEFLKIALNGEPVAPKAGHSLGHPAY